MLVANFEETLMYSSHKNQLTGEISCIIKNDVGLAIPFDPANTDYQAYLAWLEEGNVPTPADEENT
jgi:hypothetical protein